MNEKVLEKCYQLRETIDKNQSNDIRRSLLDLFHEIDRELQFINQQVRIYESLKIIKMEKVSRITEDQAADMFADMIGVVMEEELAAAAYNKALENVDAVYPGLDEKIDGTDQSIKNNSAVPIK